MLVFFFFFLHIYLFFVIVNEPYIYKYKIICYGIKGLGGGTGVIKKVFNE